MWWLLDTAQLSCWGECLVQVSTECDAHLSLDTQATIDKVGGPNVLACLAACSRLVLKFTRRNAQLLAADRAYCKPSFDLSLQER